MSASNVPKHIAFILDGNRRFAKRLMMKPWKGHEWGAKKVRDVLEWCKELGVEEVTMYSFSIQNFDRPKKEFDYLMKIFKSEIDDLKNKKEFLNKKHGVRINFIGRIDKFPEEVTKGMRELMEMTKDNDKYVLNLAMAYGGREEVIDAAKKVAQKVKDGDLDIDDINQEVFSKDLYMNDEPDMIIRTGGEHRTSNFLAWQSTYSELFFIEKMWPEFEKEDLLECVSEFNERQRRFGK